MRYLKIVVTLLLAAAAVIAADPFVGTWKVNPAKSKFKKGAGPKEQTVTISESGTDLDIAVKGTASDGTSISAHYTIPANGGTAKIIEAPYDTISGRRVNPNERDTTYSKGGKVVYTTQAKLAKDGKTLTVHAKGTNLVGQTVDGTYTYEKQ
jgi:hypothetical protein